VLNATFSTPDLDSFCQLDRLGLSVTGQQVLDDHAVLACRVIELDDWCHECGAQGVPRDTVLRQLAHVPLGWRPTILHVRVRRYRCTGCGHVWRQDTTAAAAPRAKLSRPAVLWAVKSVVIDRLSIARVAAGLGASWHTVNDAVLAAGRRLLIDDPARLNGGASHRRRRALLASHPPRRQVRHRDHRPHPGARRHRPGQVAGHGRRPLQTGVQELARPAERAFRDGIEVVAMDGFTGFKTATTEQLPDAVAVMDPFHVVALAGDALDRCRQRVQQDTRGHRGRSGDPLYGIRRVLRTGAELLTDKQQQRLTAAFASEQHVEVEATWGIYQRIVAAYRNRDRGAAKAALAKIIDVISKGVPAALTELITLGRTLTRRAVDVLAYFDRPGTSNGPTEAINGRLEHLRGTALGFRNLANYITRSLLDTGGFRPRIHPLLR